MFPHTHTHTHTHIDCLSATRNQRCLTLMSPKIVTEAVRKSRIWKQLETMSPAAESETPSSFQKTASPTQRPTSMMPSMSTRIEIQWLRLLSSAAAWYIASWKAWLASRNLFSLLKARTTERPVSVYAVWLTTVDVEEPRCILTMAAFLR